MWAESPTCDQAKTQMKSSRLRSFSRTPRCHMQLPAHRGQKMRSARELAFCKRNNFFYRWKRKKKTPTIDSLLQDLRPRGQRGVDHHEPEGDQWNKVVELVGPVHDHTQHQYQEVEAEEDLGGWWGAVKRRRRSSVLLRVTAGGTQWGGALPGRPGRS